MGQPIVVVERPSVANPGMVRFETNRALTGMGHERYRAGTEVRGDRPPDELARRLFGRGGIEAIHINGSVVTVDLAKGHDTRGLREIIETLYIHYPPTVDAAAEGDEEALPDGDQPTDDEELVARLAETAPAAPDPDHEPAETGADPAAEVLAESAAEAEPGSTPS